MRRGAAGERGSTLLAVSVLLVVFLLAAALLATRVVAQLRLVRDFRARNQSFYVAESGLHVLSERLRLTGGAPMPRMEVHGALDAGAFEARGELVPIPGEGPDDRPVYVVRARGSHAGIGTELSGRAVLYKDGLRFQAFRHGPPPEEWHRPWRWGPPAMKGGPRDDPVQGRPTRKGW